ncbi:methyltransferase family protein [Plantactinospora sp. GCM10030261]|uniref:methyltransferase family protein n=1 Tax=Plantactinospora sp. GCM10030261 TaxID=3273420 RepID=UPI00360BA1FC
MTVARYLCLAVPLALLLCALRFERDRAARGAALLAFVATALGVAALHEVARLAGWWSFTPVAGAYRGLPVDLWLGWAVLWGPVPVLLRRVLPVPLVPGLLLFVDAVAMPALAPLVRLGPHWLLGELVGLLVVALPAHLLGRWSADRRRLGPRVALQMAVFAALVLWFVPSLAFEVGDGDWRRITELPRSALAALAQVGLVVAVPALAAVREFAVRGGGTPFPWDPPRRLVTTGPYAYLANPMQVGATGLLLLIAAAGRSLTLALGAVVAVAFTAGVARPHETPDLAGRYGTAWRAYRARVRDWWPRRCPYQIGVPATLWLDLTCGPCGRVAEFLRRRRPVGLRLVTAADHPRTLWRAEYAGGDGHVERGVAAVARGLEHLGLGWAYVGWVLRLPGVAWFAQLVTDAMIAPPRPAGTRGAACPTPSSASSTARSRPSGSTGSPAYRPAPSPPPQA